jgi:large subunit ribosomal protein L25
MISLKANKRDGKGIDFGMIPAVLYGPGIDNQNIVVDQKEFDKVHKEAGEALIQLEIGSTAFSVLIHDVQEDTITNEVIHVDFYQPNLKSEVEAQVPMELIGTAPAVGLGGTIVINHHELTIKALPKDIPSKIEVDVSVLTEIGGHILCKDVKLPKGVALVTHADEVIIQVTAPTDVDAELAAPISEEKKEESAKKEAE